MNPGAKLERTVGGVTFPTPVIICSGVWPFEPDLWEKKNLPGVGGICTKAVTARPRTGNEGHRVWETPCGVLNSIGLQNCGVDAFLDTHLPLISKSGIPFLVNVAMESEEEVVHTLGLLSNHKEEIPGVELNISCPNVSGGGMSWGMTPEGASQAVSIARRAWKGPLWVKLTPQMREPHEVAKAAEASGADALVVANTWLGMAIDVERAKPVFQRTFAGLSGPAVFPLALRLVWDVAGCVRIPVIGCGGITVPEDAIAMLQAGAQAVEIGAAIFRSLDAPETLCRGITDYLDRHGLDTVGSLSGMARTDVRR